MGKLRDVLRMVVPSVTVFFLGGVVSALGLVASRLVAAGLGSSLYAWISLAGTILAGISVGCFFGGRVADRYHARRALAVLFGLSSAACVAIIMLNNVLIHWLWLWSLSWPVHVLLHVALVFFVPSALLGTMAPVVIKMTLSQGAAVGRSVGVLGACGGAGCIAGTFLTGFYLIGSYGSIAIVWIIGAALLGMALLYWTSCWALYLWAMAFAALATMGMAPVEWAREAGVGAALRQTADPNLLYEDETPYGYIAIRQMSNRPDRRALRHDAMQLSEIVIGEAGRLHQFHTEVYAGLTRGLAAGRNDLSMLVIGSGGYGFPRYLKASWPDSAVQVVEADQGITDAAREAFGLDEPTAIDTVNMDARYYVDRRWIERNTSGADRRHDFVYVDTIDRGPFPFPLVTREFNEKVADLLAEDGVYMLSLVDTHRGGRFLGAVICTLEQTFPYVDVIGDWSGRSLSRSMFVVVASPHELDTKRFLEDHDNSLTFRLLEAPEIARLKEEAAYLILTDDYAPVENLLAPAIRQEGEERLAHRLLREAERLFAERRYEASGRRYRQAAQLDSSVAVEAWSRLGAIRLAQNDLQGAADAFRGAVGRDRDCGLQKVAIASAHMNLGIVLAKMGRKADARTHLSEAAKWFRIDLERNPDSVVCWDRLGDTLTLAGDLKGASDALGRALALEPKNLAHYERLAKLLEDQHRYEEAISVARKHISLLRELGRRDVALQMAPYVDYLEYQKVKRRR